MKLSIVTICFNDRAGLAKTLASLRDQTSNQFEHWVIDGGSSDGTVEDLANLHPAWTFDWVSEIDRGIYDAMNKGTARVRGDWIWYLNSGDCAADSRVVEELVKRLERLPTNSILYGQAIYTSGQDQKRVGRPFSKRKFQLELPVCHQGFLYPATLMKTTPFPLEYQLISDWIVTKALVDVGTPIVFWNRPLVLYDLTGVSSLNPSKILKEKLRFETSWSRKLSLLTRTIGWRLLIEVARRTGMLSLYKRLRTAP